MAKAEAKADKKEDAIVPPPAPAGVGAGLLDLLGKATAEDLATLDQRIVTLEGELEAVREVRKLVAVKLGLVEKKKPGGKPKEAAGGREGGPALRGPIRGSQKALARLLLAGPLTAEQAMAKTGFTSEVFYRAIKCDWFSKLSDGRYMVTTVGKQEGVDG